MYGFNFHAPRYVATRAWAQKYPKTVAAFVRAIEEGQALASSDANAVQAAMSESDKLPGEVTALMTLPGFPIGPVDKARIQRVAEAMLEFGMLGAQYTRRFGRKPWSNRW